MDILLIARENPDGIPNNSSEIFQLAVIYGRILKDFPLPEGIPGRNHEVNPKESLELFLVEF